MSLITHFFETKFKIQSNRLQRVIEYNSRKLGMDVDQDGLDDVGNERTSFINNVWELNLKIQNEFVCMYLLL